MKIFRINWKTGLLYIVVICELTTLAYFIHNYSTSEQEEIIFKSEIPFLSQKSLWADSLISTMTNEQKIGQLFMIPSISSNNNEKDSIKDLVKKHKIGGLIFYNSNPELQINCINEYQEISEIPLLNAMEVVFSLSDKNNKLMEMPNPDNLNTIDDDSLLLGITENLAYQLKTVGIQMLFGPSLEIIYDYKNNDIDSSFIDFIKTTSDKSVLYSKTLQDNNILVCAKPLNNISSKKTSLIKRIRKKKISHKDSLEHISDSLIMKPLRDLCLNGLSAILVNHTNKKIQPLSGLKVSDSLYNSLDFKGLVISDFRNIEDSKKKSGKHKLILQAILNGSDIIMINDKIAESINYIFKSFFKGKITEKILNKKVKKILLAKAWSGLDKFRKLNNDSIFEKLNNNHYQMLNRKATEASMLVLSNHKKLIPLKNLYSNNICCINFGNDISRFRQSLRYYSNFNNYTIDLKDNRFNKHLNKLSKYDVIIVPVFRTNLNFNTSNKELKPFLDSLNSRTNLIVVLFDNYKALKYVKKYKGVILANSDTRLAQDYAAQLIFGGINASGKLGLNCSDEYCYKDGSSSNAERFKYTTPEDVGVNSEKLLKIDTIVNYAIKKGAFPGCQVFFAKSGKVFFNKSYGHHTYSKKIKVKKSDLYDLASVTKIAASTIAMMKLFDMNKLNIDTTLSYYFKDLKKSRIKNVYIRDILIHQSGFPPSVPVYRIFYQGIKKLKKNSSLVKIIKPDSLKKVSVIRKDSISKKGDNIRNNNTIVNDTLKKSKINKKSYFSKKKKGDFDIKINENLYLNKNALDTIWEFCKKTRLNPKREYVYSDMNFFMIMKLVEEISNSKLDKFVMKHFYKSLNLRTMRYKPMDFFKKERIVPTELEKKFRKELIHGYVHDPTAALIGGVSGHAGLFSNANDLAVLMQMLLDGGSYGGIRYLKSNTISIFLKKQEGSHRALGFNRQTKSGSSLLADDASIQTFGHTGFTGTCVWVDVKNQLIYVFLSNRIHPKSQNQKINTLRVRQNVQQVVYDALKEKTF